MAPKQASVFRRDKGWRSAGELFSVLEPCGLFQLFGYTQLMASNSTVKPGRQHLLIYLHCDLNLTYTIHCMCKQVLWHWVTPLDTLFPKRLHFCLPQEVLRLAALSAGVSGFWTEVWISSCGVKESFPVRLWLSVERLKYYLDLQRAPLYMQPPSEKSI